MPNYSRRCPNCFNITEDNLEPITPPDVPCLKCGRPTTERFIQPGRKTSGVVGDECDVWIAHGLCEPVTKQPVHYTSKSQIAKDAKQRGLVPMVQHAPSEGSDKNKHHHTSRWI